jgi:small nuclear ribonucleoprotein E
LQNKSKVIVNLFYKKKLISGSIVGFDEFMNIVLEEAYEIIKDSKKIRIGRVLLRGDSIMLIYEE